MWNSNLLHRAFEVSKYYKKDKLYIIILLFFFSSEGNPKMFWGTIRKLSVCTFTFLTEKETTKAAANCLGQGILVTPSIQQRL